jgi:hypothetical protein
VFSNHFIIPRIIFGHEKEDVRRTKMIEWTCTLDGNERNIKPLKPKGKVST